MGRRMRHTRWKPRLGSRLQVHSWGRDTAATAIPIMVRSCIQLLIFIPPLVPVDKYG
jgi:hypothetical protein